MREQLIKAMETAIQELGEWPGNSIQIFHHNDSDGLSSGSILTKSFERKGYDVKRFCLEKPYPEVLSKVFEQEGKILVFTDFAGRIAPLISRLNGGRNLTLILDHHVAEAATDPRVHNLDPDLFGIKGDRDISASTTCYLFACLLDPANVDLASIAAIGAVGDGFFVDGRIVGENRDAALEAVRQGRLEIRDEGSRERYILKTDGGDLAYDDLCDYVDVLGGVGYYGGGPEAGVKVCLEGASSESDRMVEKFMAVRSRIFDGEMAALRDGALRQSPNIQWFHVGKRFSPMGVKMIGKFCEEVAVSDFIDPRKFIAGYQVLANEIPGFGPIEFNQVKISMRVSPYMENEINQERAPGLNTFLPEATNRLGGFSDACHRLTAATTVAIGREEDLIEEMERIIG